MILSIKQMYFPAIILCLVANQPIHAVAGSNLEKVLSTFQNKSILCSPTIEAGLSHLDSTRFPLAIQFKKLNGTWLNTVSSASQGFGELGGAEFPSTSYVQATSLNQEWNIRETLRYAPGYEQISFPGTALLDVPFCTTDENSAYSFIWESGFNAELTTRITYNGVPSQSITPLTCCQIK